MDKKENHELKDGKEMGVGEKELKQINEAERKAIIRNATRKAFEKYDDVFSKLSEN